MNSTPSSEQKLLIGTGAIHFASGHRETLHVHEDYGQLKWPSTGVASVRTPEGIFVAAPSHAVWVPAGERHGGMYSGDVFEQHVFVHAPRCQRLPHRCCLIEVPRELAQIIRDAVASRAGYATRCRDADEALLRVLEEQVLDTGRRPLVLGVPVASPIQALLDTLLNSPGDPRTLGAWAGQLHMAERSLRRAVVNETGIPFSEWRKRARVLVALQRLSTGADVAAISGELGYDNASAFVYMFRTTLGITPGRYYRRSR